MKKTLLILSLFLLVAAVFSCSPDVLDPEVPEVNTEVPGDPTGSSPSEPSTPTTPTTPTTPPGSDPGTTPPGTEPVLTGNKYVDEDGNVAYIPDQFTVSSLAGEKRIATGLVVIGPDGNEFVWVPTGETILTVREFHSYFSGGSLSSYSDEKNLDSYKAMVRSVEKYGGFYMGRYEASYGSGSSLADYRPASKPVTAQNPGRIWVQFSPQDATVACENLYSENPSVQGFFPWGANWDTTLQWLIDSGNKTEAEVTRDSSGWGNYSNDSFSPNARGNYTGAYEQAKSNNIYDLAGNNWEWTQERYGSSYVMRGGGYNLMGGACPGDEYPAALRDPLPGNDHHPNVTFRVALYLL